MDLFLFLVKGLLHAMRAIFEDLHLLGMEFFIAGGVVILVTALGAFEDCLFSFLRRHGFTSFAGMNVSIDLGENL